MPRAAIPKSWSPSWCKAADMAVKPPLPSSAISCAPITTKRTASTTSKPPPKIGWAPSRPSRSSLPLEQHNSERRPAHSRFRLDPAGHRLGDLPDGHARNLVGYPRQPHGGHALAPSHLDRSGLHRHVHHLPARLPHAVRPGPATVSNRDIRFTRGSGHRPFPLWRSPLGQLGRRREFTSVGNNETGYNHSAGKILQRSPHRSINNCGFGEDRGNHGLARLSRFSPARFGDGHGSRSEE